MAVQLTVLGTSGGSPAPGGACCGYFLQTSSTNLMIDAGTGTLSNLLQHITLPELDGVVLSHEHPDHWADIEPLCVAMRHPDLGGRSIPVHAPVGLLDVTYRLPRWLELFQWSEHKSGDELEVGDIKIRFAQTQHPVLTLAMRIECEGKVLGYTADTGPAFSLSGLGDHFDFAWSEAEDEDPLVKRDFADGHISGIQAGKMARESNVDRLMLTHFRSTANREAILKEAESEHSNVFLAEENMTITI